MFSVSHDGSVLKRLALAAFAILGLVGLVGLVLAMPSYGFSAASAQTKVKPKYRLRVTISGIPSKITLNKPYTYTVKVTNTGRLAFKKGVLMKYKDANFVTGSSPKYNKKYKSLASDDPSSVGWTNIGSIKPGATKTIKVYNIYKDPNRKGGELIEVTADGIGTSYHKDFRTGVYY